MKKETMFLGWTVKREVVEGQFEYLTDPVLAQWKLTNNPFCTPIYLTNDRSEAEELAEIHGGEIVSHSCEVTLP